MSYNTGYGDYDQYEDEEGAYDNNEMRPEEEDDEAMEYNDAYDEYEEPSSSGRAAMAVAGDDFGVNPAAISLDGTTSSSPQHGHATVPLARVKQIMATQANTLPFTMDGMYAVAKSAELFVEKLLHDTADLVTRLATRGEMAQHGPLIIDYDDIAEMVNNDEDLEFIRDFFPFRMTMAEAQTIMDHRKQIERGREDVEEEEEE